MNNAMTEISGFLAEAPMCFIATVSGDEPHVRAFQYQFEQDGKLWFCTAKSKNVFRQLQANPAVEICAVNKDMAWVRVTARVSLDDNRAVKERILAEQPLIKGIYGSADNPDFTTFSIEHGTYVMADFSGKPPRNGSF
ncbi:MAG: hypothetical protein DESF_00238 [Desulfovibrio sp.]